MTIISRTSVSGSLLLSVSAFSFLPLPCSILLLHPLPHLLLHPPRAPVLYSSSASALLYCSALASLWVSPIFMACPPLFLWPAVLFWACLPPFPFCFYGLLYCRGVCSVRIFPSGFFPSGSGFPKHGNYIFVFFYVFPLFGVLCWGHLIIVSNAFFPS